MPKPAVFMKLEPDLRAGFIAGAEAVYRPASQVVRELMRELVERLQPRREHSAFLQRKVDKARASLQAGRGRSNETVDADFIACGARIVDEA